MDLTNDTALITGSSGGIGEEFARQFARRGVNLILVARRADKLEELRDRLLESSPTLTVDVVAADLSQPGSAAQLAARVRDLGRNVEILVNNAGVGLHGDFVDQQAEVNAAQVQLNCTTLVELTALFMPAMTQARHGLVLNVASTAAFQPTPGMAVYGATKAFVLSFTESLAYETKGSGLGVLALSPGATRTEFFDVVGTEDASVGRFQNPDQVVSLAFRELDRRDTPPSIV
ncbi:MAG: SDR family oxidoreductase, partial [Mycobacterium sp.]